MQVRNSTKFYMAAVACAALGVVFTAVFSTFCIASGCIKVSCIAAPLTITISFAFCFILLAIGVMLEFGRERQS